MSSDGDDESAEDYDVHAIGIDILDVLVCYGHTNPTNLGVPHLSENYFREIPHEVIQIAIAEMLEKDYPIEYVGNHCDAVHVTDVELANRLIKESRSNSYNL